MLAPNNYGSWGNHTLIYVGDFGTTVSQSFAYWLHHPVLKALQIRPGLTAFYSTPLLYSFVFPAPILLLPL